MALIYGGDGMVWAKDQSNKRMDRKKENAQNKRKLVLSQRGTEQESVDHDHYYDHHDGGSEDDDDSKIGPYPRK